MFELELPWPPSVNHYYRHVGHRVLISREGRAYRQTVCSILRKIDARMLDGPIVMMIDAHPPDRRRRDLDNILKCILDSLQHGQMYRDDSQIKELHCRMLDPDRTGGRVIISLKPLKGDMEV